MPAILTRYILRRWATPFLGALFFYGFLLIAWEMIAISREIFSQGAPLRWMFPLLLLSLPETFSMVLPMAAVLGGLLGTQQLMEGSELVAAQGLGAGRKTWYAPWAILACGLLLLASLNAHLLVPASASLQQTVRQKMSEAARAKFLRPGSPPWHPPGSPDTAFWVSEEGQVHLMESTPQGTQHLTAARMTYALENTAAGSAELQIHLSDLQGVHYQPGGDGSVIHLKQQQQTLRFAMPSGPRLLAAIPLRYESTWALLGRNLGGVPDLQRRQAAIELSRRITLPLASISLLLMGVALGFGHPRFFRGGAVIKSLGVILAYYLLMKYAENMLLSGKVKSLFPVMVPPFLFFIAGWFILNQRLSPHRTRQGPGTRLLKFLGRRMHLAPLYARVSGAKASLLCWMHGQGTRRGVFRHWSTIAWWRNWGLTLGSLLTLDLLIEFSNLAGDLSNNKIHFIVFIKYWLWNLPPFLEVAFPVSFLLGTMLALSEAALNREWLAIRAGGVSLLQWIWASRFAWAAVALATFLLQAGLAPVARTHSRELYQQILKRPPRSASTSPWMHLGSTGVLWHLAPEVRWGFPLKGPGEAPILLRWQPGSEQSEALAWGGMHLVPGPTADSLFPDRALQAAPSASEAPTLALFKWQHWAPDPERSYLLWSRLLGWLAGPLLVLALLSYAFPGPRQGRGQAIGAGLVGGLVFLGLQTLFGGAARASEIPAYWGILAPFLLLAAFSLVRVSRLRT